MDLCRGRCFLGTEQVVPVVDSYRHGSRLGRKGSDKSDMKEPDCLRTSFPNFFFHLHFLPNSRL